MNYYVYKMKLTNLNSKIINLPQYKFGKTHVSNLKKICVKLLDLKDLGKLKDRYEGQQFLENKIRLIGSYFAALDFLNIKKPDLSFDTVKYHKPIIKKDNETYVVVNFSNKSFPLLKIIEFKKPRIFVMEISENKFCVFGVGTVNVLNDKSNFEQNGSNTYAFKAFNKLIFEI